MASTLSRRAVALVSSPLLHGGRRHASAKYAHMKVKKQNWIEVRQCLVLCFVATIETSGMLLRRLSLRPQPQQNEILRENKFYQWTLSKKNAIGIFVMTIGFPVFFYQLHKEEMILVQWNQSKLNYCRFHVESLLLFSFMIIDCLKTSRTIEF